MEIKKALSYLALFLLVVASAWLIKDAFFSQPGMVTVIGEGKVEAQPELAKFTASWIGTGSSPAEALKSEKNLRNTLIDALKNYGVAEGDIQVAYPRVVPAASGGYQAVNAMDVNLTSIDSLDQAVNALYGSGVYSVANIALSTRNPEDLEEQAIEKAIADAKEKAKKAAKASHKRLGRLVSLTPGSTGQVDALTSQVGSGRKENVGAMEPLEEQVAVQDSGLGQIEVVRRVSAVYEIK